MAKRTQKPRNLPPEDKGEDTLIMEPLQISQEAMRRSELVDLAIELAARSAGFKRSVPEGMLAPLADLVRSMNCYYSNIIEGHYTHPIDIERALNNDYHRDAKKRDLQKEAKAHITVQRWIDRGALTGRAMTLDGLLEIHQEFCSKLPDDLLWVEDALTKERARVVPGTMRDRFEAQSCQSRRSTSVHAPL
jgi:Fic family protein